MATAAPTYDLVLMLDPQADDGTRAKLLADARAAIESQGELVRHDEWGNRTMTYPIDHHTVAEYHLMQFHASSSDLLETLNRSLRIADEALRFRIVKLRAGVPAAPDMRASAEAPSVAPSPQPSSTPSAEPSTEASAEPSAEPSSEPSAEASEEPSAEASEESIAEASAEPGATPSAEPGAEASAEPSAPAEPAPVDAPAAGEQDKSADS